MPAAEVLEEKEIHASPSDLEEGEIPASLPEEEVKSIDSLLPDWFTGTTVVPDDVSIESVIVEMHKAAVHLRRLPPLRLWRGNQRRAWDRCTRQSAPYFRAALRKSPSSLDFVKLSSRLFELPAITLSQTLPAPKEISDARASLSHKLRKAESLAFQDRLHEATKVLFCHGVSSPSESLSTSS